MSDKNEVFEIVKSVITSQKGGVLLKDVNRDYKTLAGEHIPYKRLGYKSIEEVLDDIPEIHSYINYDGELVFTNEGKNCKHLVELISKQKGTKSTKSQHFKKVLLQKPFTQNKRFQVSEVVHHHPYKINEYENFAEPRSYSHESLHKGSVLNEINGCNQENEKYRMCMMKKSDGYRTDLREKIYANSTDEIYNISFKHKNESYSRKREVHSFTGQNSRNWKPHNKHFDEPSQHGHWQDEYIENKNCYSSSSSFRKNDKYSSNAKPKSFRGATSDFPESYPNPLYRDDHDFHSPVGNHYKYSKNANYRSYGSPRCVPEIDYWDNGTYRTNKYGGRSEDDGYLWMEESVSNAHEHCGRKIDVIGGSLRVTIKNC